MPGPIAPSPSPPVGAGTAPGQPPHGSSPVSQPTANRGMEAAGLSMLSVIVRLLEKAVPMLGVGSEPGKDVLKALNSLARHVPAGSVSPGIQQSTMEQLMAQQKQMAPQISALRAMQGQQPGQPPTGPTAGAQPPAAA